MTKLTQLKKDLNLRNNIDPFTTLAAANFSIKHRVKQCWTVVLGCDGRFWVVCLTDGERLVKSGYEYAPM